MPIFQASSASRTTSLCWDWSGNRAVRQGDWKLVWDKDLKQWELYDLEADRTETRRPGRRAPRTRRADGRRLVRLGRPLRIEGPLEEEMTPAKRCLTASSTSPAR